MVVCRLLYNLIEVINYKVLLNREFANKIGKTVQTFRNWDSKGTLKPHHVTEGGTRYYSQEQLNNFLGLKQGKQLNKKIIGYCRVSSHKQKDDLER